MLAIARQKVNSHMRHIIAIIAAALIARTASASDCSECTATYCQPYADACASGADNTNGTGAGCEAIVACFALGEVNSCAVHEVIECYCGSAAYPIPCAYTGTGGDGACEAAVLDNGGCTTHACVVSHWADTHYAIGDATALNSCQYDFCYDACGLD